jgi:hypothetical protein
MMRNHDAVSDKVVCTVHALRDIDSCRLGRSTTLEVDEDLLDSAFLCFFVVLHMCVGFGCRFISRGAHLDDFPDGEFFECSLNSVWVIANQFSQPDMGNQSAVAQIDQMT